MRACGGGYPTTRAMVSTGKQTGRLTLVRRWSRIRKSQTPEERREFVFMLAAGLAVAGVGYWLYTRFTAGTAGGNGSAGDDEAGDGGGRK